jgi:hypothetical protein
MKLIPDWRRAWRLASVRVSAIGAVVTAAAAASPDGLLAAWQALPEDVRAILPPQVRTWITPALFAATIIGRVLQQKEPADGE